MNENPIAQLNATSAVTYLNVLASVKTSIGNAAYKQLSTATNHFLAAVGKDLTSTVGPELLEEFPRSEKLLQARFHQRDLADSTYQSTHSRVAALRTAALNLIADHALPSDFPAALTALIQKAGYKFHEVQLRFGASIQKWRLGSLGQRIASLRGALLARVKGQDDHQGLAERPSTRQLAARRFEICCSSPSGSHCDALVVTSNDPYLGTRPDAYFSGGWGRL